MIADILPPPEYILESYLVTLQLSAAGDIAERESLIARLTTLKADFDTRHTYWLKENLDSELTDIFLKKSYAPAVAFYTTAFDAFVPAIKQGDAALATAALAKMKIDYEAHRKVIDEVVQITTKRIQADEATAKAMIESGTLTMLIILTVSICAAVIAAMIIVRSVLKSIGGEPEYATNMTNLMAEGDLRSQITLSGASEGSLVWAIKRMQDMMMRTTSEIKRAVDTVSTGSHQIATGNIDLSQRTEEQAIALQQTAASMAQLTTTIKQNAASPAREIKSLITNSVDQVATGSELVQQAGATMDDILASVDQVTTIMGQIAVARGE